MTHIKKYLFLYIKQFITYIQKPISFFDVWASKGRLNWMPDKWYLSFMFRSRMGYWMNWRNPKTFNEKLQWLKIHDRNPLYTKLVDKYEVRKYIAETIGEEYLIPLLGVWDNVNDIDFEKLPNQFVLKCTHDSGSVIICKNKQDFNIRETKIKLSKALRIKYYTLSREWPYKKVKPRIIAEQFLHDEIGEDIKDYKIFCFNGQSKYIQVDIDRFTNHQRNIFNLMWEKQDFSIALEQSQKYIEKPNCLENMIQLSNLLSTGIPHVRCDWYEIKGKPFFGEMTFFHGAGFERFTPIEWDKKFGDLIDFNQKKS